MGFFQSFISDANRSRQRLNLVEPVEPVPLAESPSGWVPADMVGTSEVMTAPSHSVAEVPGSAAQVPGVQQNASLDVELEAVVSTESKPAGRAASKHLAEPVLPGTTVDIVARDKQPEVEVEPDRQIGPRPTAVSDHPAEPVLPGTAVDIVARDKQPEGEVEPVRQIGPRPTAVSDHSTEPVLPGTTVDIVARDKQPEVEVEPDRQIEPRPTAGSAAIAEAGSRSTPRQTAYNPAAPVRLEPSGSTVNPPQRPDVLGLDEDGVSVPPNRPAKEKRANKPVSEEAEVNIRQTRYGQEANLPSDMSPEVHEKRIQTSLPLTQEAVVQKSEARSVTTPVSTPAATPAPTPAQQAAPGLLSSRVDATEKPTSAREKNEPQIQIGTIEVIVESAPVMQRKSSPGTGFTRDLGRSYQRRL